MNAKFTLIAALVAVMALFIFAGPATAQTSSEVDKAKADLGKVLEQLGKHLRQSQAPAAPAPDHAANLGSVPDSPAINWEQDRIVDLKKVEDDVKAVREKLEAAPEEAASEAERRDMATRDHLYGEIQVALEHAEAAFRKAANSGSITVGALNRCKRHLDYFAGLLKGKYTIREDLAKRMQILLNNQALLEKVAVTHEAKGAQGVLDRQQAAKDARRQKQVDDQARDNETRNVIAQKEAWRQLNDESVSKSPQDILDLINSCNWKTFAERDLVKDMKTVARLELAKQKVKDSSGSSGGGASDDKRRRVTSSDWLDG